MANPTIIKSETRERLRRFCQGRGIELCVLFGSRAKGKVHPNSDWDLALIARQQPDLRKQILRLHGEFEDIFGHPVDLVIIDQDTDPLLRMEVFQYGEPLYEASSGFFVEERVLAVKIYDDTEPLRRWRDRVLAERILSLKYVDRSKYVSKAR